MTASFLVNVTNYIWDVEPNVLCV